MPSGWWRQLKALAIRITYLYSASSPHWHTLRPGSSPGSSPGSAPSVTNAFFASLCRQSRPIRGRGPPLTHCPGAHSGTSGHHGPWGFGLWSLSSPRRSGVGYMRQASANVLLTKLGLSGLKCLFILLRHRIIVCLESPYPCFLCDLYYLASTVCPGYIGRQNCPSLPSLCLQAPCIFVSCVVNLRLRSSPDSLALLVAQKSEQLLYCLWP